MVRQPVRYVVCIGTNLAQDRPELKLLAEPNRYFLAGLLCYWQPSFLLQNQCPQGQPDASSQLVVKFQSVLRVVKGNVAREPISR